MFAIAKWCEQLKATIIFDRKFTTKDEADAMLARLIEVEASRRSYLSVVAV